MNKRTLLDCPFCGCYPNILFDTSKIEFDRFFVFCVNDMCKVKTPSYNTQIEAIDAWNKRATVQSGLSAISELSKCQKAYNELQAQNEKLMLFVKELASEENHTGQDKTCVYCKAYIMLEELGEK